MILTELVTHKVIIAIFLSWLVSQLLKFFIFFVKNRKPDFRMIYHSGGMPSSHLAMGACLLTSIYLTEGVSLLLISTGAFAVYVLNDALFVRRQTEKHAKLLNIIAKDIKDKKLRGQTLDELVGHTPTQVIVGSIIGILMALLILT